MKTKKQPPAAEPTLGQTALALGAAIRVLRRIRLAVPRQDDLVMALETLRVSALDRQPGEACRGLRAIHPTGTGKSESAKRMVAYVQSQPGRDPAMTPVLHVTLGTTGTPKSAVASCLDAYGSDYSTVGSESDLLERLRVAIEENGTELLIIDELNHCAGKTLGRDVSDSLKNIMTKGWAPVALMGTSAANDLFTGNKELKGRCRIHAGIRPMDREADIGDWTAFACGMDEEMRSSGIIDRSIGLEDPDLAKGLCVACGGRIGELVNVLEDALTLAYEDGRRLIHVEDLHEAVQTRFVLDGDLDVNPLDALL